MVEALPRKHPPKNEGSEDVAIVCGEGEAIFQKFSAREHKPCVFRGIRVERELPCLWEGIASLVSSKREKIMFKSLLVAFVLCFAVLEPAHADTLYNNLGNTPGTVL